MWIEVSYIKVHNHSFYSGVTGQMTYLDKPVMMTSLPYWISTVLPKQLNEQVLSKLSTYMYFVSVF